MAISFFSNRNGFLGREARQRDVGRVEVQGSADFRDQLLLLDSGSNV